MIKELPQRAGQSNTSGLLAINAVQRVGQKDVDARAEPDPRGNGCGALLAGTRLEIPVIVGEQHQVHGAKQEAQKGHQVGRKPAREELQWVEWSGGLISGLPPYEY